MSNRESESAKPSAGTHRVPAECPNCGGPIDFAERSKDSQTIVLCQGDCKKWSVVHG